MRYVTLAICRAHVFPYIHKHLSKTEAAPEYENELQGMAQLEKVLTFVSDDAYYPTFAEKAAYLLCGLAGAQYFSNGNKRLGVTTLMQFILMNGVSIRSLSGEKFQELVGFVFPKHQWDSNPHIGSAHALFLYNLALVVGNRASWGCSDFDSLKNAVSEICAYLYPA